MLAGIKDVLVISNPQHLDHFKSVLSDGYFLGMNIEYEIQDQPKGIGEALLIGENFINNDNVCLILGDNIFWGNYFSSVLKNVEKEFLRGANIFSYTVKNPEDYGVVELDKDHNVLSIEEKPSNPKSSLAITGLYFFDNNCVEKVKTIKPSQRNELEITDLNKLYLDESIIKCTHLGRGFTWLDAGTHENLLSASTFVQTIEERQGFKIACVEEIALSKGWIKKNELVDYLIDKPKSSYYEYIRALIS